MAAGKKYLALDEAAALLKVKTDELIRLREKGEIRGFADRGTWKFKADDVEEFRRRRQPDSDPDVPIMDDGPGNAFDEEEDVGTQATIVRKGREMGSDSDVRLVLDADLKRGLTGSSSELPVLDLGNSDSDVRLISDSPTNLRKDSDSDVRLVTPKPAKPESDSDVKLMEPLGGGPKLGDSDSDVRLAQSDSDVRLAPLSGSDSDVKLVSRGTGASKSGSAKKPISDSDVALLKPAAHGGDSALFDEDEGGITLPADSGIRLSGDSGIRLSGDSGLRLSGDSGIRLPGDSGLRLSADSGIQLHAPADSGILLEGAGSGVKGKGSGLLLSDEDSSITLSDESGLQLAPLGGSSKKLNKSSIKLRKGEAPTLDDLDSTSPMRLGQAQDDDLGSTSPMMLGNLDDDLGSTSPMLLGDLDESGSTDMEVPSLSGSSGNLVKGRGKQTNVIMLDDDDQDGMPASGKHKATAIEPDEFDLGEEEELEVSEDVLGEDDELEDLDAFDDDDDQFDESFESGASRIGFANKIVIPQEAEWSGLYVTALFFSTCCLIFGAIIGADLTRSTWANGQSKPHPGQIEVVSKLFKQ